MAGQAKEKLGKTVNIRRQPTARSETVGYVQPYNNVLFEEITPDLDNPENKWLKLSEGRFVNYIFPPNGLRFDILTSPPPEPEPKPDGDYFSATITDPETGETWAGVLRKQ
jgi:hypothetical protein